MTDSPPTPKKVKLDDDDVENMTKEDLLEKFKEQEKYIKFLEEKQKLRTSEGGEDFEMKESEEKLKQQHIEAARRENTLVLRLTTKEQELQDYLNQIQEFKAAQTPSTNQLRSMLLDPAINLVFQHMAKEMEECKERQKQTQNELSAWKFTADSQTGKRLMAKCRMLLQENEDLGKLIASGRTAKLEGEIALEKTLVQEMKKNQADLDEFLAEIDEDVEGMQSMMYLLQQQLKESKEQIAQLKEENKQLKVSVSKLSPPEAAATNCNLQSSPQPSHEITAPSSSGSQRVSSPVNINTQAQNVASQRLQSTDDITNRDTSSPSECNNEKVNSNGTINTNPIAMSEMSAMGTNLTAEEFSQNQDIDSENHEHPQLEESSNCPLPSSDLPASTAEVIASSGADEGLTEIVSSPSENQNANFNHFSPSDNSDVSNEAWSPKNQPAIESADEVTETKQCLLNATTPVTDCSDNPNNWTSNKNSSSIMLNNSGNNNNSSTSLPMNNGTMAAISEVETDD